MLSPDSGGQVCYLQICRYPIQVGVRREKTIEFINPLLVALHVRLHKSSVIVIVDVIAA